MQRITKKLQWLKSIVFQFMFVLHNNSISNKHLLVLVQLIQIVPLVYFYLNPIYSQLQGFYMFKTFFDTIWPQIFVFTHSQQFILVLMLLSIFPAIIIALVFMKLIVGYQYLIIVAIDLWLVAFPIFFVKFTIETFNILIAFSSYRVIGVVVAMLHTIGSVITLHMYDKKHKLIDMLPILLIHINTNQYVVLAIVIVRLITSYFIAPNTLIKPLRIRIQSALLIIILFAYFASDNLTNYIAFILLLSVFSLTEVLSIIKNYNSHAPIFYHLQNLNEEQSQSRLKYYEFVQEHRINCENVFCMCRQLGKYKKDEEIQEKAYEFVRNLYSFKEDFYARIQLGAISCQQYEYTLSGLLLLLELKPQSIYQQYLLYYVKTKYQQQYRKHDKNYTFGQEYHNAYQDLRSFQQKIQTLTRVLKDFWNTILYFDGSKKFLALILNISEQITQIKQTYDLYIDKYEQFGNNFKYLYKTFEIAILNLLDKENQQSQNTFGVVKQQIQIKIPQRMLFFISNSDEKIVNCNRQFCNLVEIDKQGLINKSYAGFVPETCNEIHSQWVQNWYQNYNRDQEAKQTIKTLKLTTQYMKAVKMQNKILPRFDKGIEIITFIKLINKLELSALHKASSESGKQLNTVMDDNQIQTFFSFLIEKNTMKIVGMDDSFFYTTMIEESDELRKKILELRLNEIFPKIVMVQKDKEGGALTIESHKQVMLNYSVLDEFVESKQKNNMNMFAQMQTLSRNTTLKGGQTRKTLSVEGQEERSTYARRSPKKHTTLGMTIGGNTIMNAKTKENSEQVFLYEIVGQVNSGLDVEYCIVNFKLKKNIVFDNEAKMKEQQKQMKSKSLHDKYSDPANSKLSANNPHDQVQGQQQQDKLLPKQQAGTSSLFANLSHRQPFIRSSKPYKQQDGKKQIQTKKAQLQQSDQFNNQQKNYCLPWPILLPLFIVHFIYSHISLAYSDTFLYLQKTFDFYDKYELEILGQLNVPFDNMSYQQDLKALWMQGYGFYHQSILTFQNPNDTYFIDKLYNQVIKQYHFGIYQQIHASLEQQLQDLHLFLYIIIAILSLFILYVLVDFVLNLKYCFRISGKVTQIILIFLNISQTDINKLIYSITKYQTQVLEIVSFADIQHEKKLSKEDYKIHDPENLQQAELSGIGLLKQDPYSFGLQSNLKNLDSFGSSPPKNSNKLNQYLAQPQQFSNPPSIVPKTIQSHKRNSSLLHKRKNSRAQRLDLQKLKQSINNLRSPPEQSSERNILLQNHKRHDSISKSSFGNNPSNINASLNNDSGANNIIQYPQNNVIDKIQQEDSELSPEEQSKLSKINNFKRNFRGKLNDIRENPRSYILLLTVLILTVGVFVTVFVLIPKFIANFDTFSNVYFDLRKLKIVLYKEIIEKATTIPLQPDTKSSVYSQDFYNEVQEKLNDISNFQQFWKTAYSNNVCPYINDPVIKRQCEGLDSLKVSFGQKIMIQYLQDLLRRKNASQLFQSNSKDSESFMTISRIQAALVSEGDKNMNTEMLRYLEKVANLEMIVAGVGTVIFVLCLMLTHKALKDIRLKIKDGQNLLLVMPQNIKKKYIQQMKKNRMKQLTKELTQEHDKRRAKKRRSKKLNSSIKQPSSPPAQTAIELMGNNSSLIKEDDGLLKNSLKNSTASIQSLKEQKDGAGSLTQKPKPSKFKS